MAMDRAIKAVLKQTIDIQKSSGAEVDDRGNSTATWSTTESSVKTYIREVRDDEDKTRNLNVERYLAVVDPSVNVDEFDRIIYDGKYYEVDSVRLVRDFDGSNHHKRVEMQRATTL